VTLVLTRTNGAGNNMIINEGKLADESKAGFCAIRYNDVLVPPLSSFDNL